MVYENQINIEDLSLYYVARHDIDKNLHISIWLANEQEVVENSKIYQSCVFQPSISIASSQPFISIDQYNQNGVDEDTKLNALLYRKKKLFLKATDVPLIGSWIFMVTVIKFFQIFFQCTISCQFYLRDRRTFFWCGLFILWKQ